MILLAIDIGNSTTVFGIFSAGGGSLPVRQAGASGGENKKLIKRWPVKTIELLKKLPEWSDDVVVSSVVPSKDKIIRKKYPQARFVTASNIKGIEVRAKRREVGADRVVNALAAKEIYGTPVIIIDFGTATTFEVVSKKGDYLGGAIAPGIGLSAKVLHDATAKLPEISLKASKVLIGKNTKDAINSGLLYGYVSMIEGMIKRLSYSLSPNPYSLKVIATGGYAKLISKYTKIIDAVDPDLTLKGLRLAYLNLIRYNN